MFQYSNTPLDTTRKLCVTFRRKSLGFKAKINHYGFLRARNPYLGKFPKKMATAMIGDRTIGGVSDPLFASVLLREPVKNYLADFFR